MGNALGLGISPNLQVYPSSGSGGDSSLLGGLIGYWKFEELSGTRYDSSGNGHDLTDNNGVGVATGVVGNGAVTVAATNRWLSLADSGAFSVNAQSITMAGWAAWQTNQAYDMVLTKGQEYQIRRDAFSNDLDFLIDNEAGHTLVSGCIPAVPTAPVFICAWYDADLGTLNLQINNTGALTSTVPYTSSGYTDSGALIFGRRSDNYNHDGLLDEWGIWNRVLTADERDALYNGGSGLTYPFS